MPARTLTQCARSSRLARGRSRLSTSASFPTISSRDSVRASSKCASFWKDPAREAADSDRAAFERLRAAAVAYFYDRNKALQMQAELDPKDYNLRAPPAFLQAEGKYNIQPEL